MALVDYFTDGGVALLTLNDPPVNGYTHEMMKDLDTAILEARFDNRPGPLQVKNLADGFVPEASRLDTIMKASLIYSF